MRIKDILDKKGSSVITIGPQRTVRDAIQMLCAHRIGALVVQAEAGEIVGIVTERDVLRECGERCPRATAPARPEESLCQELVQDVMTKSVIIGMSEGLAAAAPGPDSEETRQRAICTWAGWCSTT